MRAQGLLLCLIAYGIGMGAGLGAVLVAVGALDALNLRDDPVVTVLFMLISLGIAIIGLIRVYRDLLPELERRLQSKEPQ